jgi:mono/diheme cytochrome c family protein
MRSMALATLMGVALVVEAQTPPPGMSQGELLYTTHCGGCHTTEVHWREKKIAKDWRTLVGEVRRWQTNSKLGWGDEEIGAVAHYLNGAFYHFPEPEEKKIGNAADESRTARSDKDQAPCPPSPIT